MSSREERRKQRDLDEARKAGNLPPEKDADGSEINPHIPQFISKAPWYVDPAGQTTLKHQRLDKPANDTPTTSSPATDWYARGQRAGPAATKYRRGACANCGALSHKTQDCMERPRKLGAKWSGKDIQADEVVKELDMGWDAKRDRWNGYDPEEHRRVVEEYEKLEEVRQKIKEQEAASANEPRTTGEGAQETEELNAAKSKNLRIREDKAKYLINLDLDSAHYDPKTRSMRENPNPSSESQTASASAFVGENFTRMTGDAQTFQDLQVFAWQAEERDAGIHLQANPTEGALKVAREKKEKQENDEEMQRVLRERYGGGAGTGQQQKLPEELLLAQSETYVEYSRHGIPLNKGHKGPSKSRYEEDVCPNNHTSVFGSWWSKIDGGRWGYACCHQFTRNSYCTGREGIVATEEAAAHARGISTHAEDEEPMRKAKPAVEDEEKGKVGKDVKEGREAEKKRKEIGMGITEEDLDEYRRKRRMFEDPMADYRDDGGL
ncbi:mRNA splicing protein [Saitoella coloradoensis]